MHKDVHYVEVVDSLLFLENNKKMYININEILIQDIQDADINTHRHKIGLSRHTSKIDFYTQNKAHNFSQKYFIKCKNS